MKRFWAVHESDGELVAVNVEALNVSEALSQFVYAEDGWYAVPQQDQNPPNRWGE